MFIIHKDLDKMLGLYRHHTNREIRLYREDREHGHNYVLHVGSRRFWGSDLSTLIAMAADDYDEDGHFIGGFDR